MLAVIAHLDGSNALMFHVEHSDNGRWLFQARWPESEYATLREWTGDLTVENRHCVIPLSDPTTAVEVRWKREGARRWWAAKPMEWVDATCSFAVLLKQDRDFTHDPVVIAGAMVGGDPSVFEIRMPARFVRAGELVTVEGTAFYPGAGVLIKEAGEFATSNDAFAISNESASKVTLRPIEKAVPGELPWRGAMGIRAGALSDEELVLFKEYLATRKDA